MTAPTFKQYRELLTQEALPGDAELCELFGLFRNNKELDRLKAEREKLRAKKTDKEKEADKAKDAIFRAAKYNVDRDRPVDAKGSATPRQASAAARGHAAERDWVSGMTEAEGGDQILADLWDTHGDALVDEHGDDPKALHAGLLKLVNPAVARRLAGKATEDWIRDRVMAVAEAKKPDADAEPAAADTVFSVDVPAYVFGQRGYTYSSVPVRVQAASAEEAGELVNQHKADVRRHLQSRQHPGSGKPLVDPKKGAGAVVFKDTYHATPSRQAVGRHVLTRHGGFKAIRGSSADE